MATYIELIGLSQDSTLRQKIAVACVIAAENIRVEDVATANHVNRLAWAKTVWASPTATADKVIWTVLAQNKAATVAAMTGATDASIQTAVDAAVAAFV